MSTTSTISQPWLPGMVVTVQGSTLHVSEALSTLSRDTGFPYAIQGIKTWSDVGSCTMYRFDVVLQAAPVSATTPRNTQQVRV